MTNRPWLVLLLIALAIFSVAQTSGNLWLLSHQAIYPKAGSVVLSPPTCPADLNTVRIGICVHPTTGELMFRDSRGIFRVAGVP